MNFSPLKTFINRLAPAQKNEAPAWVFRSARALVVALIFALPLLYDPTVAEVAGDLRWAALHTITFFVSAILLAAGFFAPRTLTLTTASALIAAIFLSTLAAWPDAINMSRQWYFFKHIAAYCTLFFIIFALWTPTWQRTLIWAIVLPMAVNGYLVICQFLNLTDAQLWPPFRWLGLIDFYQQVSEPAGTFANKNLVASWWVFTLPLCAFLFATAEKRPAQIISGSLLLVGMVALAFSHSRASWISLIVAAVALGIWAASCPTVRKMFNLKLVGLCTAAVVVFAAALFVPSGISTGSFTYGASEHITRLATAPDVDLLPRVAYNLNGLHIIKDHPLNGVGLGGFQSIYPLYHEAWIPTPEVGYSMRARPQRAHNDLLQAFVETGIIGGLLQVSLFVYALFMCVRLAAAGQVFPVFAGVSITGLGVNALGDFPLQMPTAPALLMVIIGLVAAQYFRTFPSAWHKKITLPKGAAAALAALALVACLVITVDDYHRRKGAQHLKEAMALVVQNVYSPRTKMHIDESYKLYPHSSRLQEFRSTIYTNLSGPLQQSPDKRIEVTEETTKVVPHSANNLVNMGWAYYLKATRLAKHGQTLEGITYAHKVLDVAQKLQITAPFSPQTEGLKGLAYLFMGKNIAAEVALKNALKIDPTYAPARAGLSVLATQQR